MQDINGNIAFLKDKLEKAQDKENVLKIKVDIYTMFVALNEIKNIINNESVTLGLIELEEKYNLKKITQKEYKDIVLDITKTLEQSNSYDYIENIQNLIKLTKAKIALESFYKNDINYLEKELEEYTNKLNNIIKIEKK